MRHPCTPTNHFKDQYEELQLEQKRTHQLIIEAIKTTVFCLIWKKSIYVKKVLELLEMTPKARRYT